MYLKSFLDAYSSNGFSLQEARSEISFALDVLFNFTYKDFLLDRELSDAQIEQAQAVFDERTSLKKPIQLILGQAYFLGRRFFTDKYTLIPRPETELLVTEVLVLSKQFKNPEILDIGTGTGCIGISLMLENPEIKADMSDIQLNALKTAQKNAVFHKVSDRAGFIQSDLFTNIEKKYDIIVSNPPYIPLKDKENLQLEVKQYEPSAALFAKDELGLEFYEKIITDAPRFLKNKGAIGFELGIKQAEAVKNLLKNNGFSNIEIKKDFNSIDRIITAFLPNKS